MEMVSTSLYEIACHGLPLKRLGLFLKPEYAYGDDDDDIIGEDSKEVLKADIDQKALRIEAQKRRFADTISRAEQKMRDCKKLKKGDDDHHQVQLIISDKKKMKDSTVDCKKLKKDDHHHHHHQVQLIISDKKKMKKNQTVDCKRRDVDDITRKAIIAKQRDQSARLALRQMEKVTSDDFNENMESRRELDRLRGTYVWSYDRGGLPLKSLGLSLKPEHADVRLREDLEEGEISDEEYWEEVDIMN